MYLSNNIQTIRPNKKETSRSCINCTIDFFKSHSGILNFCSEQCRRQEQYEKNKNPLSTYGKTKKPYHEQVKLNNWSACAYDEAVIDNDILNHIEYLCTDEPFIEEDLEYLERVMREEFVPPKYSDGTIYKRDPIAWELRGQNIYWWKNPISVKFKLRSAQAWQRKPYKVLKERLAKQQIWQRKKISGSY